MTDDARPPGGSPSGWVVRRLTGSAAHLHGRDWPDPLVPTVWVMEVARPALVLGSTQRTGDVDATTLEALGIELAHRRSGGGAVLVEPGASVWIDVLIPIGDRHWDDDVTRSFRWVGEVWVRALGDLGLTAAVHEGGLVRSEQSSAVCFAGLGPGEVTVDGVKAVGLSQRRTRVGARFQCVCYRHWHPAPLAVVADVEVDALPPVREIPGTIAQIEAAVLHRLA